MLIFTQAIKSNSQFATALSEVRKHCDVRYGMLRVASGENSGRIFIVDGAFIIGCELSDGRKGAVALTSLVSMARAIVGFLEMPRRTGGGGVAVNIESLHNDCLSAPNENVGNVLRRVLNMEPVQFGGTPGEGKQPAPHSLMMHVIHNQVRKELGPSRDATSSGAAATLTEIVLRNLDTYNKLLQRLDRAPDKNFISRSELLCADIAMFESLLESSHRNTYAAQSVKRLRQTLLKIVKRARAQPSDYEPTAAQQPASQQPAPLVQPPGEPESDDTLTPAGLFSNLASTLQHDIASLPDPESMGQSELQPEEAQAPSGYPTSRMMTTDTGSIRVFSTDMDFGEEGLTDGGDSLLNSDQWQYGSEDPFDWGESLFLTEEELAAQDELDEVEEPSQSYALQDSDNGDAGRAVSAASAMSAVPPSPNFGGAMPPAGGNAASPAASVSGNQAKVSSSTDIPDNLRFPHAGLSAGLVHEHDVVKEKVTDSTFRRELKQTDSLAKRRVEKHTKSQESKAFVVGVLVLMGLAVGACFLYQIYLAPPSAKKLYERSLVSEEQKFFLRAREDVDKAIVQDPQMAAAYTLRARLRTNNGEFKEALEDYNQAIKLGASDDEILKGRAEAAFRANAWEDAQDALQKLLNQNPDDLELHHKLATTYIRLNKAKEAVDHYTRAITGGAPDIGPIYRNRGLAYEALNDDEKATEDYTQSIKLNPADQVAFGRRGSLFLKRGNVEAAFSDLSKASEKTPSPEALLDLASIYVKRGDHVKAGDLATRALDLNRKNVRALMTRANSYLAQKAFPRALDDLDEAMRLEPGNAGIRSLRDKVMSAYRAASPSAVRELETSPSEPKRKLPPIPKNMPEDSLIYQGYEQLRNGHPDVAVQMLTEALIKEPSNEIARRYLAHALFRARHPLESAEQFKLLSTTSELSDSDQVVYGDALAASGQTVAAIEALKKVVANSPTSVAARALLGRSYLKNGDREKAEQLVSEGLQLTTDVNERRQLNAVLNPPSPVTEQTDNSGNPNPSQQQR
jgi:tetratricopeptide (TPR) repeat protein